MYLRVVNNKGIEVGKIEVDDKLFNAEWNDHIVYHAVVSEEANKRQGTASAKTRGEVSGGSRKPWPQKGTGRARHGSIRSPIWVGGGIVFPPKPREWGYYLPKKMKRKAFAIIVSDKARSGEITVIDKIELSAPKTKQFIEYMKTLLKGKHIVLIIEKTTEENREENRKIKLATRNIPYIHVLEYDKICARELFYADQLIFTESSIKSFNDFWVEKIFGKEKKVEV